MVKGYGMYCFLLQKVYDFRIGRRVKNTAESLFSNLHLEKKSVCLP